ncbi:MAG: GNAT family N-acetyltransferase [Myxococcota bacterium]
MPRPPDFADYRPHEHGEPIAVTVRAPTFEDLSAVAHIWAERENGDAQEAMPLIWKEWTLIRAQTLPRTICVAEVAGEIAGYGRCGYRDAEGGLPEGWYLIGIIVSPPFRRRGVGRALTGYRLKQLILRGAEEVFYFTDVDNLASVALHKAFGFVEIDRGRLNPKQPEQTVRLLRTTLKRAGYRKG